MMLRYISLAVQQKSSDHIMAVAPTTFEPNAAVRFSAVSPVNLKPDSSRASELADHTEITPDIKAVMLLTQIPLFIVNQLAPI